MISHYLAVDGGASKTTIELTPVDARGCPSDRAATIGPSSLTLPGERAFTTLVDALAALLTRHRLLPAQCLLVAGVAGAGNPVAKAALEKALGAYPHKRITTDAHIALLGVGGGEAVNCITVGTGAVAARFDGDGGISLFGGWGFPVGDRGGGAWLGFIAVRALIGAVESGAFNPLEERLGAVIGTERTLLLAWLAQADATQYAHLAPTVLECAEANCTTARRIVLKGVVHITRLAKDCCDGNDLPVVFCGGLGRYYQVRLPRKWQARCIAPSGNALDGARLLALQIAGEPS